MNEIIIKCPINHLSYGNISYNILRELFKSGIKTSIFPVSNKIDISIYDKTTKDFSDWIQEGVSRRYMHLDRDAPFLNIWHIAGAEDRISNNSVLYTFHETSEVTEQEKNICKLYNKVIFSSTYSSDIFNNSGLEHCGYSNPGFDEDLYINNSYKLKNKIHFGIMGKLENRKHTIKLIKLWIKNFGNDHNYQLSCCVTNPFLPKDHIDKLKEVVFDGRNITNVNFLEFMPKNSQVNAYLNSIDIDIGGMSGAEGWNLPSFNATCLGKWSIVLNCTAHKDWANKHNCILVEPNGQDSIEDGVFFTKGSEFNAGNKYSFNNEDFENALHKAINKVKNNIINEEGLKLTKIFTYKNTLKNIIKHFDI
tara:strand:- start:18299 stop:19390 length:1092 start_codon:yes stop_codon:yes gene_type:complete